MTASPALETRALGISFGGLRALDDVSIHVSPGEIVGIIGPNGAGKTTLFDCVGGFQPCEGSVLLNGIDVSARAANRRAAAGLGRSFQDARLYGSLTVIDALRVSCELKLRRAGVISAILRLPRSRADERESMQTAVQLVESLGLQAFANKLITELSTGTRRIVDIGRVLAQRPSVLLLDEPSSGIAQKEAEALAPLLRSIRDETGAALVVIEHDMPLLLGLSERVYAMAQGAVIAVGTPAQIVHEPGVISSYLGTDTAAIARSGAA